MAFTLTEDERRFIESGREKGWIELPASFLADIRCKRRGWQRGALDRMLSYERAREIADEAAIIYLSDTETIPCYDPDPAFLDSIVRNECAKRASAFQRFQEWEREQLSNGV